MLAQSPSKLFFLVRRQALTLTALAILTPGIAWAAPSRQENIDAVNAITKEIARYKLAHLYIEEKGKELLFLGSNHTYTPTDPQIAGVEALFKAFEPTLVLIEGGTWPAAASKEQAVSQYGELGFTQFLSAQSKTKVMSADAPLGDTIAAGLTHHSAADTKLYFALSLVPQWAKQATGKTMKQNMEAYLASAKFALDQSKKPHFLLQWKTFWRRKN